MIFLLFPSTSEFNINCFLIKQSIFNLRLVLSFFKFDVVSLGHRTNLINDYITHFWKTVVPTAKNESFINLAHVLVNSIIPLYAGIYYL